MSTDSQGRNIAENLNRLRRAHERYRRQLTTKRTGDSIREFTFANKHDEARFDRTESENEQQ